MDKATKVAVEKYPHGTFDGPLGDSIRAACAVGYMQAEKDMMLEMRQWILRQRGFGMVALRDFEKYMRGNGHE